MATKVINNIPEWRYQAEIVARLHKLEDDGLPIACAGDMNAARRTPSQIQEAKALGMTAGEPDVRVYLPGARIAHIEVKNPRGRVSDDQEKRHERLKALGHHVEIIGLAKGSTPASAAEAAEAFVRSQLGRLAA